jgi:hypothetical protein
LRNPNHDGQAHQAGGSAAPAARRSMAGNVGDPSLRTDDAYAMIAA